MFPGRLHVGVGHGVQNWMAQVGAAVESPMTLLREYLTVLRSLLSGDEVTTAGRYVHLERVKLDWPPTEPTALLAGAVRPRSLRLVGEISDGAILVAATSPRDIRQARTVIEEGRLAAGRSEPVPVTVYLLAATGPDAQNRVNAMLAALPDKSSRFAAVGAADLVANAVRELAEAGADRVILQPTADEPDPEGFVRFVAQKVRALVP
jgi:alkanesulfonate monooxygenase SsuD/methylene tetrahydromethanopterin reductase-like flavin-dependent oxidoreductase (luciferase family)